MAAKSIEKHKTNIIAKLSEAGPKGLPKSKLGVKDLKSPSGRALKALITDRRLANLGTRTKTRFVLMEHFKPLELACEQIEKNAKGTKPGRADQIQLLIRKDLEKGCEGEVRKKVDEAIDWLVKEQKLLRALRGRTFYYISADRMRALFMEQAELPITEPEPLEEEPALDKSTVFAAYLRVRGRLGYSNVEISELRKELGVPMDRLKSFLVEQSRLGNAVLSLGDWSVSSEAVRSGAIELYGRPHLLVSFKQ
ncbi:MAG: hypothetical protein P8185_21735 [Deltaproteobacteria bacterium]|jgi:hypothetical protein